jgi:RimJ/RimL family protein N-acetyltransferase
MRATRSSFSSSNGAARIGFQIEGRLRQDTFRDGRYWNTIVMAVLRDEWGAMELGDR